MAREGEIGEEGGGGESRSVGNLGGEIGEFREIGKVKRYGNGK